MCIRDRLRAWWDAKLTALTVRTPHENMNRSLNIWNLYQSEILSLIHIFTLPMPFVQGV